MAALTAASWTVTISDRKIQNGYKRVRGTLALAGTDTYPTGGVPMPTFGNMGFSRNVDEIRLIGQAAATTQYLTEYDKTNNKMLFYEEEATAAGGPLLEADAAEVPGPRTWDFEAQGW